MKGFEEYIKMMKKMKEKMVKGKGCCEKRSG